MAAAIQELIQLETRIKQSRTHHKSSLDPFHLLYLPFAERSSSIDDFLFVLLRNQNSPVVTNNGFLRLMEIFETCSNLHLRSCIARVFYACRHLAQNISNTREILSSLLNVLIANKKDTDIYELSIRVLGYLAPLTIEYPQMLFYVQEAILQTTTTTYNSSTMGLIYTSYNTLGKMCAVSRNATIYARDFILRRLSTDFENSNVLIPRLFMDIETSSAVFEFCWNRQPLDQRTIYMTTSLARKTIHLLSPQLKSLLIILSKAGAGTDQTLYSASAHALYVISLDFPFIWKKSDLIQTIEILKSARFPSSLFLLKVLVHVWSSCPQEILTALFPQIFDVCTMACSKDSTVEFQVYGTRLLLSILDDVVDINDYHVDIVYNLFLGKGIWASVQEKHRQYLFRRLLKVENISLLESLRKKLLHVALLKDTSSLFYSKFTRLFKGGLTDSEVENVPKERLDTLPFIKFLFANSKSVPLLAKIFQNILGLKSKKAISNWQLYSLAKFCLCHGHFKMATSIFQLVEPFVGNENRKWIECLRMFPGTQEQIQSLITKQATHRSLVETIPKVIQTHQSILSNLEVIESTSVYSTRLQQKMVILQIDTLECMISISFLRSATTDTNAYQWTREYLVSNLQKRLEKFNWTCQQLKHEETARVDVVKYVTCLQTVVNEDISILFSAKDDFDLAEWNVSNFEKWLPMVPSSFFKMYRRK